MPADNRRFTGCAGKRTYLSRTEALHHAVKVKRGVYRCPVCRCIHVGGRPDAQVKRLLALSKQEGSDDV